MTTSLQATPCTSDAPCEAAVGRPGLAQCFDPAATPAGGFCDCGNGFALAGPTCEDRSGAGAITALLYGLGMAWFLILMLRFAPETVKTVRLGLFKFNAAGVSFIFTWVATLCFALEGALNVASVGNAQAVVDLASARLGATRAGIIFLTCAVLNMTTAFVEMSRSTRVIANVERYRAVLIVTIVALTTAVTVSLFLAPTIVTTVFGLIIVGGLSIAGLVGPAVLYVRSARNLVVGRPLSTCTLLRAMFLDAVCGGHQMLRLLGFSQSGSSGSRGGSREGSRAGENSSKDSSKLFSGAISFLSSLGGGGGGGGGDGSTGVTHPEANRSRLGSKENLLAGGDSDGTPNSSRRGSKDEGESYTAVHTPEQSPSLPPPQQHRSLVRQLNGSKVDVRLQAHEREAKMISFLSRTLRMGLMVSFCLFSWLVLVGINTFVGDMHDQNPTYRVVALLTCLQDLFIAGTFFAIFKYLEHQYVSSRKKMEAKRHAAGAGAGGVGGGAHRGNGQVATPAGSKDSKGEATPAGTMINNNRGGSRDSKGEAGSKIDASGEVTTLAVENPVFHAERGSVTGAL